MSGSAAAPRPRAGARVAEARFFRSLGYSSVWEDEAIVTEGLRPRPGDRVLSITSGGCFTLQLLLAGAEEVVSVDFSPHQTALLAFKVAAARALTEERVWAALGLRPAEDRLALYRTLREALEPEARAYWDARPAMVGRGVALAGRQDRYLHAVGGAVRVLQGDGRVRRLLACPDLDAQRVFYDREWNGSRWRALCAVVFSRFVLDRAFDPAHFAHAREGGPAARFRAAAERLLRDVPAATNFYLHYLFTRTYASDACCPAWLRRGVFTRFVHAQSRAPGRAVRTISASVRACSSSESQSNAFERLKASNDASGEAARTSSSDAVTGRSRPARAPTRPGAPRRSQAGQHASDAYVRVNR